MREVSGGGACSSSAVGVVTFLDRLDFLPPLVSAAAFSAASNFSLSSYCDLRSSLLSFSASFAGSIGTGHNCFKAF